jgi:hypothetical protein
MTTGEVLNLDYTKEENKKIIQKALRLIKPFKNESIDKNIEIEKLEKYIKLTLGKYNMILRIIIDRYANEKYLVYCSCIMDSQNLHILRNIYSMSIYELYCKICIFIYSKIKSQSK